MSEVESAKLFDIGEIITGKTPSKNNPEDWGNEMPFVTPSDYGNYRKRAKQASRNLSQFGIETLKKKILPPDSLLVTCIGSDMGKVVMNGIPVTTNQQINSIIPNERVDNDFLYYALVDMYDVLRVYGGDGTAVPIINKTDFGNLEISLPPLSEQKAIASVLSCLDDKIDLLHRQNKTLEAMAETLFRQWFVVEADDSWEVVKLQDVAKRITDGAHASPPSVEIGLPMASVKDMHNWGIDINSCRKISEFDFEKLVKDDCRPLKDDILIAKDGSYLKHIFYAIEDLDIVILSSIAIVRPNGKYHPTLLTLLLKQQTTLNELENIVTGAVIPRIVLKDFRIFPILLPPYKKQLKALEIIQPLMDKCYINKNQITLLEHQRDTLLPKLMSGEVRVEI
ncbi:MAG: restriction endonuclease subunit S [Spirochaetes bacterium]|nr:restriction endonuclease subunit S [Spirochaetota bacterium]MBN2769701.1 restriction endonuclease subunit S [Spirochaetota bacterium]